MFYGVGMIAGLVLYAIMSVQTDISTLASAQGVAAEKLPHNYSTALRLVTFGGSAWMMAGWYFFYLTALYVRRRLWQLARVRALRRSDERRVGEEWGSTGRARGWRVHEKKKMRHNNS